MINTSSTNNPLITNNHLINAVSGTIGSSGGNSRIELRKRQDQGGDAQMYGFITVGNQRFMVTHTRAGERVAHTQDGWDHITQAALVRFQAMHDQGQLPADLDTGQVNLDTGTFQYRTQANPNPQTTNTFQSAGDADFKTFAQIVQNLPHFPIRARNPQQLSGEVQRASQNWHAARAIMGDQQERPYLDDAVITYLQKKHGAISVHPKAINLDPNEPNQLSLLIQKHLHSEQANQPLVCVFKHQEDSNAPAASATYTAVIFDVNTQTIRYFNPTQRKPATPQNLDSPNGQRDLDHNQICEQIQNSIQLLNTDPNNAAAWSIAEPGDGLSNIRWVPDDNPTTFLFNLDQIIQIEGFPPGLSVPTSDQKTAIAQVLDANYLLPIAPPPPQSTSLSFFDRVCSWFSRSLSN